MAQRYHHHETIFYITLSWMIHGPNRHSKFSVIKTYKLYMPRTIGFYIFRAQSNVFPPRDQYIYHLVISFEHPRFLQQFSYHLPIFHMSRILFSLFLCTLRNIAYYLWTFKKEKKNNDKSTNSNKEKNNHSQPVLRWFIRHSLPQFSL